jgi:hypothetical protein
MTAEDEVRDKFTELFREIWSLQAQLASARKALEEILFGTDIDEMRRTAGVALRDSK